MPAPTSVMRCWMWASLALLLACAPDGARSGRAPLHAAEPAAAAPRELLVLDASEPRPQTDERPSHALALRDGASVTPLPGRWFGGLLGFGGALLVNDRYELVELGGQVLDREVLPELSLRADGEALAYPRRAGSAAPGVYVLERSTGAHRLVTGGLASADRPLFLDDGRLVVVGARASGIAGVWIVDLPRGGQLVPVSNASLRVGRPLGPDFVPPPASHRSMRIEAGALVYDDGRGERRLALPEGAP